MTSCGFRTRRSASGPTRRTSRAARRARRAARALRPRGLVGPARDGRERGSGRLGAARRGRAVRRACGGGRAAAVAHGRAARAAGGRPAPSRTGTLYVEIPDGKGKLKAVTVETLITDGNMTAIDSADLKEGDEIIVSLATARASAAPATPGGQGGPGGGRRPF